jgi:rhodanese-related sulfurtransferase
MQSLKQTGALNNRYNSVSLVLTLIALIDLVATQSAIGQIAKPELPEGKQTTLGLYVTAKEAYEKWKTDSVKVKILDVRTHFEYLYIGHPAMAWNIPLFIQWYEWDATKKHFPLIPNPDFMRQINEVFQPDDIILVTCRSGGRSALAVNQLAEAGFKHIYNITDGFEGDIVKDPESVFQGQRMKNGWKNSGLPWTYHIDPERIPRYKSP